MLDQKYLSKPLCASKVLLQHAKLYKMYCNILVYTLLLCELITGASDTKPMRRFCVDICFIFKRKSTGS